VLLYVIEMHILRVMYNLLKRDKNEFYVIYLTYKIDFFILLIFINKVCLASKLAKSTQGFPNNMMHLKPPNIIMQREIRSRWVNLYAR
jgi:hypothetical protein